MQQQCLISQNNIELEIEQNMYNSLQKNKENLRYERSFRNSQFRLSQLAPAMPEINHQYLHLHKPFSIRASVGRLKIYESFQYNDQVTLRRLRALRLKKKTQHGENSKHGGMVKNQQREWRQAKYRIDKEQQIQEMQVMADCLEELKSIKGHRNLDLILHRKDRSTRKTQQTTDMPKIRSSTQISQKILHNRNSLTKTLLLQKQTSQKLKQQAHQLNLQQFRRCLQEKQSPDLRSLKILGAFENISNTSTNHQLTTIKMIDQELSKNLDNQQGDQDQQKQQENQKLKQKHDIEDKKRYKGLAGIAESKKKKKKQTPASIQFMKKIDGYCHELDQLLKMRIRHQAQYNLQVRTKKMI